MTIKLNREHNLKVNHKRIYRLMDILKLKSVCRRKRKNYIKSLLKLQLIIFLIEILNPIILARNGLLM